MLELTLEAPLVLGEQGAVQLQVAVGEADGAVGARSASTPRPCRADSCRRSGLDVHAAVDASSPAVCARVQRRSVASSFGARSGAALAGEQRASR